MVYVRQSDIDGATKLLDRLRNIVGSTPVKVEGGNEVKVTFSAGVVSLENSNDWRKSLTQADEALYQSKERGRNCVTKVS